MQTIASQAGTKPAGAPGSTPTSPTAAGASGVSGAAKAAPKAGKKLQGSSVEIEVLLLGPASACFSMVQLEET